MRAGEKASRSSPFSLTAPPVGSISRVTSRAVVDLPQPLSPTRPRVSPRRMWKSMPSTAFSVCVFSPASLEKMSPCSVKCLVRPLTSSSMSSVAPRTILTSPLSVQMARRHVAGRDLPELRHLAAAEIHGVRAARMEFAAGRRLHHVAHRALDGREVLGLRVEPRDRVQQADRIGMLRIGEDLALVAELDQVRGVHYADLVAGMGD